MRRTQLQHKALCTLQRGASECPVARWFGSNDLWPREHWNEEKTALSAWPTHRSGPYRQWAGCSDNHWIHGGSVFLESYRWLIFFNWVRTPWIIIRCVSYNLDNGIFKYTLLADDLGSGILLVTSLTRSTISNHDTRNILALLYTWHTKNI